VRWGRGAGGIVGGGANWGLGGGGSGGVVHWVDRGSGGRAINQLVNAVQNCIGTVQGYQVLQYV
jgi:hypothetical protein